MRRVLLARFHAGGRQLATGSARSWSAALRRAGGLLDRLADAVEIALAVAEPGGPLAAPDGRVVPGDLRDPVDGAQPGHVGRKLIVGALSLVRPSNATYARFW